MKNKGRNYLPYFTLNQWVFALKLLVLPINSSESGAPGRGLKAISDNP